MGIHEKIVEFAKTLNIEYCGFTTYNKRDVFVCLFPYYTGEQPPFNMARYARLPDYHQVINRYLQRIADFVQSLDPSISYELSVDRQGIPERRLAELAGLGWIGKNSCLINPQYGSFVFIGAILLSTNVARQEKQLPSQCGSCSMCKKVCPTGVLSQKNDFSLCISRLTQQKRITDIESDIIQKSASIWGCDLCQNTCPYNRNIPLTPIEEFFKNQINSLVDLEQISNKQFQTIYKDYAFTWRGKQVLLRNQNIINQE